MALMSVDFPHPFGPRIATCSPVRIVRLMSCSTTAAPRATFTFCMCRNSDLEEASTEGVIYTVDNLRAAMTQNSLPPIQDDALPRGFRFAAVKAGIKPSGKPDFAVAVADKPASAAALFTSNRVKAAPLTVGAEHLTRSGGQVRVVAVNAGNANCATGEAGLAACREVCAAAAKIFGVAEHEVFPSSTGIIGVPLPAEKL